MATLQWDPNSCFLSTRNQEKEVQTSKSTYGTASATICIKAVAVCLAVMAIPARTYAQSPELPDFSAAVFSNSLKIDNPYWPMNPGRTWTYEGEISDPETGETETETIIVEVLLDTRTVWDVETRIVRDRVFLDGLLIEDTFDWYAQDDAGNIWYMGEEVTDFEYDEEGNLIGTSHPGAWEAGVDGALPGHIMKANPMVGQNYYQEFYEGQAVDEGTILALGESVTVPAGTFDNVLRILDSSTLFQDFGHKSYAPGLGPVLESEFDEDGIQVGTVELQSFVVPEPAGVARLLAGLIAVIIRCRCSGIQADDRGRQRSGTDTD